MTSDLPRLGFGLPVSGSWATPETMAHVARTAEELGYASLWTFQRVLSPAAGGAHAHASSQAQNPGARAADDAAYQSVQDPLLPLAYVAGLTQHIGLGTATICAPFTPPALLAKSAASLDQLCAGRLTLGLGIGWMPDEYAAAGVPYEQRGARMEEYLRCLTALWTHDPVEFAGEFYTVPRSQRGLVPVQQPHPPVLLGGSAPAALRRAGRLAQGWIASSQQDPAQIAQAIAQVRAGADEVGRDPGSLRFVVRAVVDLTEDDPGPARRTFQGTREQVLADAAGLAGLGVTEVFADLNFSPAVGSPRVPEADARAEAERVLHALAPAHLAS